jgi:uncharacterized membrane protein YqiK
VWPVVQQIQYISLNTITLEVNSPRVYTKLGVPISVTGIAQVQNTEFSPIIPVPMQMHRKQIHRTISG